MANTYVLDTPLKNLAVAAAEALRDDLRHRLEEALAPILDDVVNAALDKLTADLAVSLQAYANPRDFVTQVQLIVDGVKRP